MCSLAVWRSLMQLEIVTWLPGRHSPLRCNTGVRLHFSFPLTWVPKHVALQLHLLARVKLPAQHPARHVGLGSAGVSGEIVAGVSGRDLARSSQEACMLQNASMLQHATHSLSRKPQQQNTHNLKTRNTSRTPPAGLGTGLKRSPQRSAAPAPPPSSVYRRCSRHIVSWCGTPGRPRAAAPPRAAAL